MASFHLKVYQWKPLPAVGISPRKYTITDKHGMKHDAYSARITIERAGVFPLYLGLETVPAHS